MGDNSKLSNYVMEKHLHIPRRFIRKEIRDAARKEPYLCQDGSKLYYANGKGYWVGFYSESIAKAWAVGLAEITRVLG